MESEKLEDLLLLSLSASKGQRERSEVLDVGVTRDKNLREVIVKYSGDIDGLQIPGMEIQKLLAGYAIVKLPEDQIGALVAAREIEYVEMPKNLQTGLYEAKRVSCILPLLSQGDEGAPLDGKGVLIAVLDSGIDYRMPDFRKEDGSSRILALWDQELEREFSQEQIDEALQAESRDGALELVPSIDRSGHGTAVAAIAAGGNPNLRRGALRRARAVGREAFPKTEWLSTYDAADERSVLVAFQSCQNRAATRHQHQLRKLLRTA